MTPSHRCRFLPPQCKVKEEPVEDDYKEEVTSSLSTQVIKDEPTVPKVGAAAR